VFILFILSQFILSKPSPLPLPRYGPSPERGRWRKFPGSALRNAETIQHALVARH